MLKNSSLKYSPSTYRRNMEELIQLRKLRKKHEELIRAQKAMIDSYDLLIYRKSEQHPETTRQITFARQNLTRCERRQAIFATAR